MKEKKYPLYFSAAEWFDIEWALNDAMLDLRSYDIIDQCIDLAPILDRIHAHNVRLGWNVSNWWRAEVEKCSLASEEEGSPVK